MFSEVKELKSLQCSAWPKYNEAIVDERAEKRGDIIVDLIGEIRREKAEKRMSLNTQIKKLTIYAGDQSAAEAIIDGQIDICGASKVEQIVVLPEEGSGRMVGQFPTISFVAEYQPASNT